jgi:hypothetical protein
MHERLTPFFLLQQGGFECVDTTNSLTACGGCPGPYGPGQDCLAIPGALNVQCADSKCIVGESPHRCLHPSDSMLTLPVTVDRLVLPRLAF